MMTWWSDGTWNGYGGWWGGGIGMALMMALIWLPLIGLGIWLVGRVTRPESRSLGTTTEQESAVAEPPRAILDRRFANGEINAEQYAQMRRTLEQ